MTEKMQKERLGQRDEELSKGSHRVMPKLFNHLHKFCKQVLGIRISKYNSIKNNKLANKLFKHKKLKHDDRGFYYVDPMPTKHELDQYYSTCYWSSRNGKEQAITVRDLIHYRFINYYLEHEINKEMTMLNFGAGHGGASHLFWDKGFQVINIEPSEMSQYYEKNWLHFRSIDSVESDSVDIVYASHSIEHVIDIDAILNEFRRVVKHNGLIFIEVPNALYERNGAQTGVIDIPHTYYFFSEVFYKCFWIRYNSLLGL